MNDCVLYLNKQPSHSLLKFSIITVNSNESDHRINRGLTKDCSRLIGKLTINCLTNNDINPKALIAKY